MRKIMIHKQAYYTIFLAMLVLIAGGCQKAKLDNGIPLINVSNSSASSIRFFNFYGDADITVNNIPLTAYSTGNSPGSGTVIGQAIFPAGVWKGGDNGSPFTLPNSLVNKEGASRVNISPRGTGGAQPGALTDTVLINNVAHPQDYYLMPDGHLKAMPRDNMPSANPQNFKIRIINLPGVADQLKLGLIGPVSLTYADGSNVSSQLNNIAIGATSPYIELPYGAHQFKLFIAGGGSIDISRQLAEMPVSPYFDPCNPGFHPQQGLSPRVRTFKPGGVYSIVVTLNRQTLFPFCDRQSAGAYVNSYRIITELDPGVNNTFARMQAVNALPGKQISISVDGQDLGGQLPYVGLSEAGKALQPEYKIFVRGNHHITAKDQSGAILAEADLMLYPFDNYTIWAYHKPDGKAALLFAQNDMTGSIYASGYHPNGSGGGDMPDDGTNGIPRRVQYNYALQCKFLNLSPDLPYATFTNDHQLFLPAVGPIFPSDTIRYFNSYINLAPGMIPASNTSLIYSLPPISPGETGTPAAGGTERKYVPSLIRVYQSSPGSLPQVPGSLLTDVAPIDLSQSFIANAALYSFLQFKLPETGVYTVALVGRITGTSSGDKARLIVIKHNK